MSALADRIRKSREITVVVGGIKFTGIRATAEQFSEYTIKRTMDAQVARNHITGWDGVVESDLIVGGKDELVAFDPELFSEVIGDKPLWSTEIAVAVLSTAVDLINKKGENSKK